MNPQEAKQYLQYVTTQYSACTSVCAEILEDPAFCAASGSSTSTHEHHCGEGALLVHTAEVVSNAVAAALAPLLKPKPSLSILVTAGLFHDVEKRRDYQKVVTPEGTTKWTKTEFGKRIYHVAGSYATWITLATKHGCSQGFIDAVGHCILAHHGRKEFGSPVEPQTIEAMLLHQADMLSASYGAGR